MLICALAVILGGIVQYPWYDAMFFPLLALLPASRLDSWLVGRISLISIVVLPGVGITTSQYREARVAVPVFMACFLISVALGNGKDLLVLLLGECVRRKRDVSCFYRHSEEATQGRRR